MHYDNIETEDILGGRWHEISRVRSVRQDSTSMS